MPIWTHELPDEALQQSLPIHRTPSTKVLKAVITSENLIGTFTHFFRGRTSPCERPDCEACGAGHPWRYHAYVGAWSPVSNLHFIFEVTAQAAEHLVKHRTLHQTLRGCEIEAWRWGKRANGRVILKTALSPIPITSLPSPPDLIKCLSVLWNIPTTELDASGRAKQSPHVTLAEEVKKSLPGGDSP